MPMRGMGTKSPFVAAARKCTDYAVCTRLGFKSELKVFGGLLVHFRGKPGKCVSLGHTSVTLFNFLPIRTDTGHFGAIEPGF